MHKTGGEGLIAEFCLLLPYRGVADADVGLGPICCRDQKQIVGARIHGCFLWFGQLRHPIIGDTVGAVYQIAGRRRAGVPEIRRNVFPDNFAVLGHLDDAAVGAFGDQCGADRVDAGIRPDRNGDHNQECGDCQRGPIFHFMLLKDGLPGKGTGGAIMPEVRDYAQP